MASGNRRFSVHEVLDILDDSADGECTIDDEPVMEGSDDEFDDILFEEDYDVLQQSPDSFIDTEERHTPSPPPLGPTFTITESPLDVHVFSHFFTDELIDEIVKQSNLYASHVMGKEKYNEWDKITVSDLKAYFGFYILMGINHLPSIHDYWRVDPFVRFSPTADRITRNRFKEITRYLHFVDNTQLQKRGEPNYDRLGKIRPIMLILKQKFLSNYEPNCQQAIDEAMIPFQGRSAIKQYLPMKPIKCGLKVWVRADSHHGYFSEFSVYEGQSESAASSQDGLGMRVVKSLTRHLVGKFHHIYFDNFFSSPKLLHDLLQDGIYACGTVRVNRRGWPNELKNKTKKYIRDYLKLEKRGDAAFRQQGPVHAVMWLDNQPVTAISSNCQPETGTITRKQRDGSRIELQCPSAIISYSKYMGGVDRGDQLRQYYHVRFKSHKLYKYVFWFLFDVSITNSYVLFHHYSPQTTRICDTKTFRLQLAKSLIGDYNSRKTRGRPSTSADRNPVSTTLKHFPIKHKTKSKKGSSRCWYCSHHITPSTRRETFWYCFDCEKHLCHTGERESDCFLKYHKEQGMIS